MSKAENFIHYLEEYFNTSDNDELEQELFEECVKNENLEKENVVLQERVKELEKQVNDLCPVGDLVGFPAWRVEKAHMMDNIAKLETDIIEESLCKCYKATWQKAKASLMERFVEIAYDFIMEKEKE